MMLLLKLQIQIYQQYQLVIKNFRKEKSICMYFYIFYLSRLILNLFYHDVPIPGGRYYSNTVIYKYLFLYI